MTTKTEDLDRLILEALDADDRAVLGDLAEEPGYFAQAFGLFRGKLAWVMWIAYVVNIIGAGLAIWAAWKMFQTTDPVMTIRWGVGVVVAVNVGLFMKGGLGLQMQNNRILRELKRVELQLARGQARESV
ncbi:MAG: hypothetical protein ACJAU5_000866 [Maricaulis maris]|jgi:hypothetical protein|uniref:Uncharacterized protein n=1 Tax=Maricaulis maris (strain MCS10) TaxID=394221 RepID=Q0AS62_MARMM|nr:MULTISPECIES: DUF6768 family protein [Maricaulis]ABI64875.1 hypothetical protein Mmar10_0582 [Maricaulis maris MCS10]MAC90820.1 hypothetical protein [Maricaulis sp.]